MSTHNICFYGEIRKIIPELSPNTPPSHLQIRCFFFFSDEQYMYLYILISLHENRDVCTHYKNLTEALLMSTHNVFVKLRKSIKWLPLLVWSYVYATSPGKIISDNISIFFFSYSDFEDLSQMLNLSKPLHLKLLTYFISA